MRKVSAEREKWQRETGKKKQITDLTEREKHGQRKKNGGKGKER